MKSGREKNRRVSNPSNAFDERGNGSKCSFVWLIIPKSGRDAIRRRPWGRSRAFQFTRLVIVAFRIRRYRRQPSFMGFSLFFRCGSHNFGGWRWLRQPSGFRRNQRCRSLHSYTGRRRCGKSWQRRNRWCCCCIITPDGGCAKRWSVGTRRHIRSRRLWPSRSRSMGPWRSRPWRVRTRNRARGMWSRRKLWWRRGVWSCRSYGRCRRSWSWRHGGRPRMHRIKSWQRGLCRSTGAIWRRWWGWWDWRWRRRQCSLCVRGCNTQSCRQRL